MVSTRQTCPAENSNTYKKGAFPRESATHRRRSSGRLTRHCAAQGNKHCLHKSPCNHHVSFNWHPTTLFFFKNIWLTLLENTALSTQYRQSILLHQLSSGVAIGHLKPWPPVSSALFCSKTFWLYSAVCSCPQGAWFWGSLCHNTSELYHVTGKPNSGKQCSLFGL